MPSKRTRRTRNLASGRITPEAIEAFRAGDWLALHEALGLGPHETSPLSVTDDPADRDRCTGRGTAGWESWPQAVELRAALMAATR